MNIIVFGIIACEIGFWVFLIGGLALRYLAKQQRASTLLLLALPLLDLALLGFISWDLVLNNAVAEFAHGLGAVYLGFTVAFGKQVISRTDAWFEHRFAGGPQPVTPPKEGLALVTYEWQQWLRMALCALISSAILGVIILVVNNPAQTQELLNWFGRIGLVTGVWLLGWPVWETARYVTSQGVNTKD
ncbi:hypothetical protein V5R04_13755 [Jonesiaceae bacterium BS-20]|uniref:YmcC n=1 Tax=Jonesiaceae bacterium BS-20 TaxID=3120821 RepID=A0AAU7DUC7_9MICO